MEVMNDFQPRIFMECAERADCKLYTPSSLVECLELLSHPLPRDHFLVRDSDKLNSVTLQDITTGTGTEQYSELARRRRVSLTSIPRFIDELTYRNVSSVGIGLINITLQIEPESDDDGVPIESSENSLCDIVGGILLQIQNVSCGSHPVTDFIKSFLTQKEQLVYNKYKLLKSVRSVTRSLTDSASNGIRKLDSSLVRAYSNMSSIAILNNFSDSSSLALKDSLKQILAQEDSLLINKIIVVEMVDTQIQVCKDCGDWSHAIELFVSASSSLVSSCDEEVWRVLVRLLLADKLVLHILLHDEEDLGIVRRLLSRLMRIDSFSCDFTELIQTLHDSLELRSSQFHG